MISATDTNIALDFLQEANPGARAEADQLLFQSRTDGGLIIICDVAFADAHQRLPRPGAALKGSSPRLVSGSLSQVRKLCDWQATAGANIETVGGTCSNAPLVAPKQQETVLRAAGRSPPGSTSLPTF